MSGDAFFPQLALCSYASPILALGSALPREKILDFIGGKWCMPLHFNTPSHHSCWGSSQTIRHQPYNGVLACVLMIQERPDLASPCLFRMLLSRSKPCRNAMPARGENAGMAGPARGTRAHRRWSCRCAMVWLFGYVPCPDAFASCGPPFP